MKNWITSKYKRTGYPILVMLLLALGTFQINAQQVEIEYDSDGGDPQLLLNETGTGGGFSRILMKNSLPGHWTLAARNGPGTGDDDFNLFYDNGTAGVNIINIDGDGRRSIFESDVKINKHVSDPIMTFDVEDGSNAFINFEANGGSGLAGYIKYFAQQNGSAIPSYLELSAPGGDNYLTMFGAGSATFGPSGLGSGSGGGARLRVVHDSDSGSPTLRLIEKEKEDFVRLFFTNQDVPENRFQIAANPGNSNPRLDLGFNGTASLTVVGETGNNRKVGIVDLSPEYTLSVDHSAGAPSNGGRFGFNLQNTASDDDDNWTFYTRTSTGDLRLYHDDNTTATPNPVLRVTIASSNGAYTQNSDVRLKKNISTLVNQLDKVLELRPTKYQFKNQKGNSYSLGLIAQEVQEVFPDVVNQVTNEEEDGTDYLGIEYSSLIPVLVGAIQDQQDIIDVQKSDLEAVKAELAEIRRMLKAKN